MKMKSITLDFSPFLSLCIGVNAGKPTSAGRQVGTNGGADGSVLNEIWRARRLAARWWCGDALR